MLRRMIAVECRLWLALTLALPCSTIPLFGQNLDADSLEVLRAKAEHGDAKAQAELGGRFYLGRGVSKDYTSAALWVGKAADQGDALAQGMLGSMYYKGQGVAQDYAAAVLWSRKAAEQDNAVGESILGTMYYAGD